MEPDTGKGERGFTLIEVMTSVVIGILILVVLLSMILQVSTIWRRSAGKIESFQSARIGFELLVRELSQATLNTYLDYDNAVTPTRYLRKSELDFVISPAGASGFPGTENTGQSVFFQAPLHAVADTASYGAMDTLLNACGYYVSFTDDATVPAHVAGTVNRHRYRLMRMVVPAEQNTIYKTATGNAWFLGVDPTSTVSPVADNVIALLIRPQDPGSIPPDVTGDYTYDARLNVSASPQPITAAQLPPVLQITLVAIDESTSRRLIHGAEEPGEITRALAVRFRKSALFQADLNDLENDLDAAHIPYRIFSSAVPLRESKWSK